jgi:hypothetical protein
MGTGTSSGMPFSQQSKFNLDTSSGSRKESNHPQDLLSEDNKRELKKLRAKLMGKRTLEDEKLYNKINDVLLCRDSDERNRDYPPCQHIHELVYLEAKDYNVKKSLNEPPTTPPFSLPNLNNSPDYRTYSSSSSQRPPDSVLNNSHSTQPTPLELYARLMGQPLLERVLQYIENIEKPTMLNTLYRALSNAIAFDDPSLEDAITICTHSEKLMNLLRASGRDQDQLWSLLKEHKVTNNDFGNTVRYFHPNLHEEAAATAETDLYKKFNDYANWVEKCPPANRCWHYIKSVTEAKSAEDASAYIDTLKVMLLNGDTQLACEIVKKHDKEVTDHVEQWPSVLNDWKFLMYLANNNISHNLAKPTKLNNSYAGIATHFEHKAAKEESERRRREQDQQRQLEDQRQREEDNRRRREQEQQRRLEEQRRREKEKLALNELHTALTVFWNGNTDKCYYPPCIFSYGKGGYESRCYYAKGADQSDAHRLPKIYNLNEFMDKFKAGPALKNVVTTYGLNNENTGCIRLVFEVCYYDLNFFPHYSVISRHAPGWKCNYFAPGTCEYNSWKEQASGVTVKIGMFDAANVAPDACQGRRVAIGVDNLVTQYFCAHGGALSGNSGAFRIVNVNRNTDGSAPPTHCIFVLMPQDPNTQVLPNGKKAIFIYCELEFDEHANTLTSNYERPS